ncbi:MAG TPA: HepT-like ribonuclease domain-containing protein [Candidatus Methanoperedens sp.]
MKQDDRYLTKVERFIKEEEFIMSHTIENDVTERALLYSLQVSIEISMDIVAMKLRDMGLKVDDDATNIEKIESQGIITQGEADFLKEINGVRNFIVHRYNQVNMNIVNEALSKINGLKTITLKVADY